MREVVVRGVQRSKGKGKERLVEDVGGDDEESAPEEDGNIGQVQLPQSDVPSAEHGSPASWVGSHQDFLISLCEEREYLELAYALSAIPVSYLLFQTFKSIVISEIQCRSPTGFLLILVLHFLGLSGCILQPLCQRKFILVETSRHSWPG
jgi:hypothetical protein